MAEVEDVKTERMLKLIVCQGCIPNVSSVQCELKIKKEAALGQFIDKEDAYSRDADMCDIDVV